MCVNGKGERGGIYNRPRAQQLTDFRGLLLPGTRITPTNIDMSSDYRRGEHMIMGELKLRGEPLPDGQRRHMQYHGNRWGDANGLVFVADHDADDPATDIVAHTAIVRELWNVEQQRWQDMSQLGMTVGQLYTFKWQAWGLI